MKLGETDTTQIRVLLFIQLDADGSAVTGFTPAAHELQTSRTATAWSDAAGTLVELANGAYYYQGVAADASVEGFLAARINRTGYRGIAFAPVVGTSGQIWIPFTMYTNGALSPGAAPSASEVKMSVNGAALVNATGTFHEIGGGAYYYVHDVANLTGFVGITVNTAGYDTAIAWGSIPLGASSDVTPPTATIVIPGGASYDAIKNLPVTITVVDAASALTFVSISVQFTGSAAPETIYAGSGDRSKYHGPYGRSTVTGNGSKGIGFTFGVTRDGGWPKGLGATFSARAVDAVGNVMT